MECYLITGEADYLLRNNRPRETLFVEATK
jgi:hypothetical protein